MLAALDAGAGPESVTWPMLLAGLGVGALASQLGSVTVSAVALTTSFFSLIKSDPNVPESVSSKATVELASGVPFVSDSQLRAGLEEAGVPTATADAIVSANSTARLDGLRASLAVLAGLGVVGLMFTWRIPTVQPSSASTGEPSQPGQPAPPGPRTGPDGAGARVRPRWARRRRPDRI